MAKKGYPETAERPNYTRPQRTSLLSRGPQGQWRMVSVSDDKARQLASKGPETLVNYVKAVFKGEIQQSQEEIAAERFFRLFKQYQCLMCLDAGLITLEIERADERQPYNTAFACNCDAGHRWKSATGSMAPLFAEGYKHPCQLASDDGSGCYHRARCTKACTVTLCSKFERENAA